MSDSTRAERRGEPASRIGALLWSCCFQFFVAEQIARMACTTPYSMTRDYISDLGAVSCGVSAAVRVQTAAQLHAKNVHAQLHAICSPLHWVMNSSFVLQGVLIFFGALLVRRHFPAGRGFTAALGLLALAGLGVMVVGLSPEDVHYQLHIYGAAVNFLGSALGMMVMGAAMLWSSYRKQSRMNAVGWISLLAGTVALLATLLMVFRSSPLWAMLGWGIGTVERIAAYPLPIWLTGMGVMLITRKTDGR